MWKPKGSSKDRNDDNTLSSTDVSTMIKKTTTGKRISNASFSSTSSSSTSLTQTNTSRNGRRQVNNSQRAPQNKLLAPSLLTDEAVRRGWKPGAFVEVYSESQEKWNCGKIIKIFNDSEGEWLVIQYAGSAKEIQRFNECIRPIPEDLTMMNQHDSNKNGAKPFPVDKYSHVKDVPAMKERKIPSGCRHGTHLTMEELRKIKLRNRKVCYVRGLPSFATETLLRMNEWYGQFDSIVSITINPNKANRITASYNERFKDSIAAFITFDNEISAQKAIHFSNTAAFGDGRKLKAVFGIQYYCTHWLQDNGRCMLLNCRYRHEWADDNDVMTPHDLDDFKSNDCGLSLRDAQTPTALPTITNQAMPPSINMNDQNAMNIYGMMNHQHNAHSIHPLQQEQHHSQLLQAQQLQILMKDRLLIHALNQQLQRKNDKFKAEWTKMSLKCKELCADTHKWKEEHNKYQQLLAENMRLKTKQSEKFATLKNEMEEMKQQHANLTQMYEDQLTKLKETNLKLADDNNVLQIKCRELERKYNAIQSENDGTPKHYLTWNANDVADWIVNLNHKEYGQYKNALLKNMSAEGVNGHCLGELDRSDLHRLGVTGFKHKKEIYQSVQHLTKQTKQRNQNRK